MKKFLRLGMAITLVSALFATHLSYANTPPKSEDKWSALTVSGSIFSTNARVTDFSKLSVGYEGTLQLNLTKNIYTKGTINEGVDKNWGGSAYVGYIYSTHVFSPYVELGWNIQYMDPSRNVQTIDYDIGSYYQLPLHLNGKLSVFAEMDNPGKRDNYWTGGLEYNMNDHIALTGQVSYNNVYKSSNGKLTVAYRL